MNGYLYGFDDSILTCIEFATGKRMWRDRSVGKGAVAYADGHLYLLGDANTVGLAEASPSGYVEKGRFTIPDKGLPSWAHPVVSDGRLYVRNQDSILVYDIKANIEWKRTLGSEWRQYEQTFPMLARSRIDQLSLECANSRVPIELIGLLEGKDVLVGAIDVATERIETPEEVAATIRSALKLELRRPFRNGLMGQVNSNGE